MEITLLSSTSTLLDKSGIPSLSFPRPWTKNKNGSSSSFSFRLLRPLLLMFIAGSFLTACLKSGNEKLTAANLDTVTIGMKKTEVKTILGEPNRVETGQFTLLEKTTYYYESRGAKVTITFLNDAVVSKDGSFN